MRTQSAHVCAHNNPTQSRVNICKALSYIGFWSGLVNQSLTATGTILPCYIYESTEKLSFNQLIERFTMQSLPTPLTTKALKTLLAGFPDNADIRMGNISCTVRAPDGTKILSAIKAPNRALWHVMAMPGMITIS